METTMVSTSTELLMNILIASFSLLTLSWVMIGVQEFFNNCKREKREEETAKRDEERAKREAEYHKQRMKEYRL